MARFRLRDTDDWKLVHDEQDVRGWRVLDASGREAGTVEDMIVDDAEARVDTLVLSDGREIPAADVFLGDDAVYLEGGAEGSQELVTVYDDYGRVTRRQDLGESHVSAFRSHYGTTYGSSGRDYDYYDPAYRFGHEMGSDDRYSGKDYGAVENDLRTTYSQRYTDSRYDDVSDAVRHGYGRARMNTQTK